MGGGFPNEFPELFIEMTQVIKSTVIADVHNILVRVQEELAGKVDLNFVEVFEYCETGR